MYIRPMIIKVTLDKVKVSKSFVHKATCYDIV